ncbi:TetR/AcrR family transcriptional regulator [Burkholderia cenocepacia]|uniref:TetR/AcrR family transcriptional regulator n=1 Tax=Burkholderia cenocepacia TaxID=95486 RepID=UPI00286F1FCD|nr:TetR/AcrR family transcriptional regulator [Burkholderia cenocepacia]
MSLKETRPKSHKASSQLIPIEDDRKDVYRILQTPDAERQKFGLREMNKLDKLQRIFAATRRQFSEIGYDGTSLRDIANEARVALGTLSFYADNKRELVLLVFNATMVGVIEKCRLAATYEGSLCDALVAYFRPAFSAYAAEPDLFRILLGENVFHTNSSHAREFHRLREETMRHIRSLVEDARNAGEIKAYIDLDVAARTIFFLLFASVRLWICTDQPAVDAGLAEMRGMVALLIDGMRAPKV